MHPLAQHGSQPVQDVVVGLRLQEQHVHVVPLPRALVLQLHALVLHALGVRVRQQAAHVVQLDVFLAAAT